jgi:hypothetical protein
VNGPKEKCVTGSTKAPFWSGGRVAVSTCIVFILPFVSPFPFSLDVWSYCAYWVDWAMHATQHDIGIKKTRINLKSSYAWELVFAFSVETTLGHGIALTDCVFRSMWIMKMSIFPIRDTLLFKMSLLLFCMFPYLYFKLCDYVNNIFSMIFCHFDMPWDFQYIFLYLSNFGILCSQEWYPHFSRRCWVLLVYWKQFNKSTKHHGQQDNWVTEATTT